MYEKLNLMLSKEVVGITAIVLIVIGAFGASKLWAIQAEKGTISIENGAAATTSPQVPTQDQNNLRAAVIQAEILGGENKGEGKGVVVASKTGKVYHLSTCAGAKRILPANQRWFKTIAEAKAAGLKPAANCKGLQ